MAWLDLLFNNILLTSRLITSQNSYSILAKKKRLNWFVIITASIGAIASLFAIYEGYYSTHYHPKDITITGVIKEQGSDKKIEKVKVDINSLENSHDLTNGDGAFFITLKGKGKDKYELTITHESYETVTKPKIIDFDIESEGDTIDIGEVILLKKNVPIPIPEPESDQVDKSKNTDTYLNKNERADIAIIALNKQGELDRNLARSLSDFFKDKGHSTSTSFFRQPFSTNIYLSKLKMNNHDFTKNNELAKFIKLICLVQITSEEIITEKSKNNSSTVDEAEKDLLKTARIEYQFDLIKTDNGEVLKSFTEMFEGTELTKNNAIKKSQRKLIRYLTHEKLSI